MAEEIENQDNLYVEERDYTQYGPMSRKSTS